jgi:dGTP triphosphohydrolase
LRTLENARRNLKKHHIKEYGDVAKQDIAMITWDKTLLDDDENYLKNILFPRFYRHHDIKRMDSGAVHILSKLFQAYKRQPTQLPKPTFNKFTNAVYIHVHKENKRAKGVYKEDLAIFLNSDIKKCGETCSYIPNSGSEVNRHRICPLKKHKKGACEGIRVIINHIAGMTDKYAQSEYLRLVSH